MHVVEFDIDMRALGIAAVFLLLLYSLRFYNKNAGQPHFLFASLSNLKDGHKSLKMQLAHLPHYLLYAALFSFIAAFIDPHFFIPKNLTDNDFSRVPSNLATEGIAIYLILDQSGSMEERINSQQGPISKIALVRNVSTDFIKRRPSDMIGAVSFARGARVVSPLTLDHGLLLQKLSRLDVMREKSQEGTSIGYAIYKTANMIAATRHFAQELKREGKPSYEIKSSVMILVTDGINEANPLDKDNPLRNIGVDQAADYARKEGIRLYIINAEPRLGTEQFAPQRRQMQHAADSTGGKFFLASDADAIMQIYRDIDQLEKSRLPLQGDKMQGMLSKDLPRFYQRVSLYPYLIAIGMFFLFAGILLEATVFRRIP